MMDWAQVLAIVLPVMLAIVIGIFYNNRRIDDLRSNMSQIFTEMSKSTSERFAEMNQTMNERFAEMNQTMNERFVEVNQTMNQRFGEVREEIRELRVLVMEFLKREASV